MSQHSIGPYLLDSRTLVLLREGEIVRISMKTVEVLLALLERRGEVVTKNELMSRVWPDSIVEEANLSVHVALLRKTLGAAAPIETISKRGYRLPAEPRNPPGETGDDLKERAAILRGRYFWNKLNRAALERAETAFEEALRLRSGSGEALSGLCDTRLMQGLFGFNPDRAVFGEACEFGERAVAMAPESADAQASFAFSQLFDRFAYAAAQAALERARALAPGRAEPHLWSALFHALRGDSLRALNSARAATALDPVSLKAAVGSGFHLFLARQFDSEPDLEPLLLALDLEPEFCVAHWGLGLAYDRLGDFEKAEAAHLLAVRHSGGSPTMEANLARSLALAGRRGEAQAIAERLISAGLAPYRQATIEAAMGENEAAIASLERALSARDPWLVVLKVDPMLDTIRQNKRVRAVQEEVMHA